MIIFSLAYLLATICVNVLFGLILKAQKKTILMSIPVTVIGLPVCLLGLLFAFREPIQRGDILQNTALGPLLNLVAPPPDLYHPLCTIDLEPGKTEYTLDFSHKYLGNHALMVSSPKPSREERPDYSDIAVTLSVSDGEKALLNIGPERAGQFWGRTDYGALLARYKVPGDLPVSRSLVGTVNISGDLDRFLERRGNTTLKIQKFSDQ